MEILVFLRFHKIFIAFFDFLKLPLALGAPPEDESPKKTKKKEKTENFDLSVFLFFHFLDFSGIPKKKK